MLLCWLLSEGVLTCLLSFGFAFFGRRGTETEEALQRRLANARAEMDYGLEADNFEKVIILSLLRYWQQGDPGGGGGVMGGARVG